MALLLSSGAVCTAKHRKNSTPELYNQFLFCNSFLLFVRYLHGKTLRIATNTSSQKLSLLSLLSLKKNIVKNDMFFRYEDIKNMLLDKKTCAEWLPNIY